MRAGLAIAFAIRYCLGYATADAYKRGGDRSNPGRAAQRESGHSGPDHVARTR